MTPARLERVTCIALLLLTVSVYAGPTGRQPSYERAERMREVLDARPESQRSRLDYSRVLNAFRAIYHEDPASPKADASVLAVAELLAEEGRVFSDKKLLHDAIGQYAFLRLQYPATRYRFSALLSEGEIYRRDLGDRDEAKESFQLFLTSYPENPLAEQARIELNDILAEEHAAKRLAHQPVGRNAATRSQQARAVSQISPAMTPPAIQPQQVLVPSRPAPAMTPPAIQPQQVLAPSRPPPAMTPPAIQPNLPPSQASTSQDEDGPIAPPPPLTPGRISLVSGIRHWSTPVYTRIAIDLQNQVAYQAARVPGPDRIYFDLYGARLEPGLNGKSGHVCRRLNWRRLGGEVGGNLPRSLAARPNVHFQTANSALGGTVLKMPDPSYIMPTSCPRHAHIVPASRAVSNRLARLVHRHDASLPKGETLNGKKHFGHRDIRGSHHSLGRHRRSAQSGVSGDGHLGPFVR
jgi:TolA-binding protein